MVRDVVRSGLAAVAVLALAAGCTEDAPSRTGGSPPRTSRSPTATASPTTTASPTATAACLPTLDENGGLAPDAPGVASRVRLGPGRDVEITPSTVAISRKGQPLVVTGVVYAEDCRTPLAGASVYAWQTAADGRYGPSGADCCYLQGVALTDRSGRYTFDTVVPGRYLGGNPPPRHIHLGVSHPRAQDLLTELMFAGDSGVAAGNPLAVTPSKCGAGQRIVFNLVLRDR